MSSPRPPPPASSYAGPNPTNMNANMNGGARSPQPPAQYAQQQPQQQQQQRPPQAQGQGLGAPTTPGGGVARPPGSPLGYQQPQPPPGQPQAQGAIRNGALTPQHQQQQQQSRPPGAAIGRPQQPQQQQGAGAGVRPPVVQPGAAGGPGAPGFRPPAFRPGQPQAGMPALTPQQQQFQQQQQRPAQPQQAFRPQQLQPQQPQQQQQQQQGNVPPHLQQQQNLNQNPQQHQQPGPNARAPFPPATGLAAPRGRGGATPRGGHAAMQSIDLGMAGLDLNALRMQAAQSGGAGGLGSVAEAQEPGAPAQQQQQQQEGGAAAGPAKTKRSARAYHTDAAGAGGAGPGGDPYSSGGYQQQQQQAPQPQQQAGWQAEAAARAAASGQEAYLSGESDAALDQMPGQRNVLSQQAAAFNQQQLHQQGPHVPTPGQGPGLAGQIGQPPHAAGQRLAGARPKIEPDQIPAPVEAQDQDQEFFDREWFATCGRGGLPLSTTDFAAVDQGNCNPKHMRLTTYHLPATDEVAQTSQLPLALLVQPLAQLRADEQPVPVVACPASGPPRCKRCRAYINPWFLFIEGGQKFVCNLCHAPTECPPDYFANLDMSGRRSDFAARPELQFGSVEFDVPKEYWAIQTKPPSSVQLPVAPASSLTETAKIGGGDASSSSTGTGAGAGLNGSASASGSATPGSASSALGFSLSGSGAKAATKAASDALTNFNSFALGGPGAGGPRTIVRAPRPMVFFFAIDVSFSAVRSGALRASVECIRECLYGKRGSSAEGGGQDEEDGDATGFGLPEGSRVAFLTFDRSLHFWNLSGGLEQAQMLVVPDLDEPFVPMSDGLLADPWDRRGLIEGLLDMLPDLFTESMVAEAALGSAVRAVQATLSTLGGRASIFLSTIPTIGPGALKHREDPKLYGTDKEKTLFVAQDNFYRVAGEECTEAGIAVDLFLFPSQYIDVASIGKSGPRVLAPNLTRADHASPP